jgi:hypothetical protein
MALTWFDTSAVMTALSARALVPNTPVPKIIGIAKLGPVEKLIIALIVGIVTV